MPQIILVFLLFFLPFVALPFGISPFESPKVILAEILIEILLLLHFFKKNFLSRIKLQKYQLILSGIIIVLTLLHLILFPSPTSFFGNPFRLQGIFILWYLLAFSVVAANIKTDKIPNYIYLFSIVLIFITIIAFGGNENGRAVGTLGEPNALAATAIFIFPFLVFRQKNFIKVLGFIFALIIIFLSGSRSGLVAFLIESVFILLSQFMKLSIAKSFSLSLILLILSLLLPVIEGGGWFENRSVIWQTALIAGFNSLLIGSGFGNIDKALHQASVTMNNLLQHQFIDSSHNFILDFWIQGGIVGLTALTAIIFFSIKNLINQSKTLELTALLGLLTVMSFNPVSVTTLVAFWWALGQGFDTNKHQTRLHT